MSNLIDIQIPHTILSETVERLFTMYAGNATVNTVFDVTNRNGLRVEFDKRTVPTSNNPKARMNYYIEMQPNSTTEDFDLSKFTDRGWSNVYAVQMERGEVNFDVVISAYEAANTILKKHLNPIEQPERFSFKIKKPTTEQITAIARATEEIAAEYFRGTK